MKGYNKIIKFWFSEESKKNWFIMDHKFDQTIKVKFLQKYKNIAKIALNETNIGPHDYLAMIIILCIMPKKMLRNKHESFESDEIARVLLNKIIDKSIDNFFNEEEKIFAYAPLGYSEDIKDQNQAISLYERLNCTQILEQIKMNRDIISEYSRLPQRNIILSRRSSTSENNFLTNIYPKMITEYKLDIFGT